MLTILVSDPNTGIIKSKINDAFTRIKTTSDELYKVANSAPDANPAIAATAGFLFNSADYATVAANLANLYTVSSQDKGIPPGPLTRNKQNFDYEDVIFYCTDQRFGDVQQADGTSVRADTINYFAAGDMENQCFNTKNIEMYTTTAEDASAQKPSTIQIAPWYLQKFLNPPAEKKCNRFTKALKSAGATLAFAHKTPADLASDFTSVLMHELTHTKAGGRTDDSGGKGIGAWIGSTFFNKDSYGWSNCVGLKSKNNADSYAQLGTMVQKILYCGQAPDKSGNMNQIANWAPPMLRRAARRAIKAARSLLAEGGRFSVEHQEF